MVMGAAMRWLLGKAIKLPPRQSPHVNIEKDITVEMRDGVVLLADRYYAAGKACGPVVLMRSPYGRDLPFDVMAALMAERGFQVVVQSVRGTCGSGGDFDPNRQEQADGADTLDWVHAQPWFSGKLFTFGQSYLGNVQWAMANGPADKIDGMTLLMTLSNFRDEMLSSGGFTQGGMLGWTELMQPLVNFVRGYRAKRPNPNSLNHVHGHLPLGTLDQAAFGKSVSWWQGWTDHADPDDPWWRAIDHSAAARDLPAPTDMVAGWDDIFLPYQIKDFEARQAAGRPAYLTVGPWSHSTIGGMAEGLRNAIALFTALSTDSSPPASRNNVRLYLQGANEWREYPAWPPPNAQTLAFHLRSGGELDLLPPESDGTSTSYIYNPADPTPAVHGPRVIGASKDKNMSELEKRDDSVAFTSAPLDSDTDVVGPVAVALSVRSDRTHTDFFVCLCDVDGRGRAHHVSDGYIRLKPGTFDAGENGVRHIVIECWPMAYRFKRGHSMRLIVASGAHPRYARNPGTGEPLATATRMVPARQEILHMAEHGSSMTLLVSSTELDAVQP